VSAALQRTVKLIALVAVAASAMLLAGCNLLGSSQTQSVQDPGGAFHFQIPGSWVTTSSPGIITIYGGKDMPSPDAAIEKAPWYFVLSAVATDEDLAKRVVTLAEARKEARNWKDTKFGKAAATKLGSADASEMDLSATDEKGRKFEGKLLLARRGGIEVLIFAFTKPDAFKNAGYDDLKKNFYWIENAAPEEPTATVEPTKTVKPKKK